MTIQESNKKIIELLCAGKVYKEIAADLGMKPRTIRDRIFELKKQYHCNTITQLVVKVTQKTSR
jgi:DNA-binding NarL/FixJ family response regulator